jgi:hypothetical protein
MATIVDKTACELAGQGQEGGLLPISPFTALQYHFGMLLGVDDLETAQAYPRGKIRLHNAWLHREGVVWGLNVAFNERRELTVDRGFALDAAGHELHLDRLACLDLGQWYNEHKADPAFTFDDSNGGKQFSVHVVAKFKACLTRPVPSIVEPCAGAQTDTAFSRVFETIELLLRPGLAVEKDRGYHRLRILFGLEADSADYADVQTERESIQALAAADQPAAYLAALRRFAALDVIDLLPQAAAATEPASIVPEDPTEVVLANVADILVEPTEDGGWAIAEPLPAPDVTVRPSHVATATIQELVCGPRFGGPSTGSPGPAITDAQLTGDTITLTTSRPLAAPTLVADSFSVTTFDSAAGWSDVDIGSVAQQGDGTLLITLSEEPAGSEVRLIAWGTGPAPLVAADDHAPLGAPGVGGADDGTDFVKTFKRS